MKKKTILTTLITGFILLIAGISLWGSADEIELYIGLSLEQAQSLAVKNGTTLRAVSIDGQPQITTKDYRIGRLNATIVDGVVSEYYIEGNK